MHVETKASERAQSEQRGKHSASVVIEEYDNYTPEYGAGLKVPELLLMTHGWQAGSERHRFESFGV